MVKQGMSRYDAMWSVLRMLGVQGRFVEAVKIFYENQELGESEKRGEEPVVKELEWKSYGQRHCFQNYQNEVPMGVNPFFTNDTTLVEDSAEKRNR